ncbi:protein kinase domain-containing protein [Planomonospora algeriensis]
MAATPLTPDDPVRLGEYLLAGRLGEGGQGVVYLAHTPGGEPVAVKLLFRGDATSRARLERELSALESVAPFCTARVLDASVDGPRPYVVSEFVDGPSLEQRVRRSGAMRGGELERLVVGTATALAAIHAAGAGDGITSTNPLSPGWTRIEVELTTGDDDAAWAEPAHGCKGRITLKTVEEDMLTFELGPGTGCVAGTVWLTRKGSRLTYTWKDVPGLGIVTQTGDLTRIP